MASNFSIVSKTISGLEKQFRRLNKSKDPVLRYTLFLEIIRVIVDIGVASAETVLDDELYLLEINEPLISGKQLTITERSKKLEQLKKTDITFESLKSELETYFDNFAEWISQPTYSPDHPVGEKMMKEAKDEYNKLGQHPLFK